MKTKNTPGPWYWEGNHRHKVFNVYTPHGRDHMHICTVNNLPEHLANSRIAKEMKANAELIAAAPELLSTLKALVSAYSNTTDCVDPFCDCEGNDGPKQLVKSALSAIAKAEGGNE